MSKNNVHTHAKVQSQMWQIAKKATVGTHTVTVNGKETKVKNQLTSSKLVNITNQFQSTEQTATDALAMAKGKLAVDSGFNIRPDCFDKHYGKPDRDGKPVVVDMNNSGATVKIYSMDIKEGANLLLTHGSKLANLLRYGVNKTQSDKIKPYVHSVLQDTKSELRLTSSKQFKLSVKGKPNPEFVLDKMLRKISENLENSDLPMDMKVNDISIGKRHVKAGGCSITSQTLGDWIVELNKAASDASDAFSAEQSKIDGAEGKRKEAQAKRDRTEAKAKSKARLLAQRIAELDELLKNTSTDDAKKVEGAKEIVSSMLDEATETK